MIPEKEKTDGIATGLPLKVIYEVMARIWLRIHDNKPSRHRNIQHLRFHNMDSVLIPWGS